MRRLLTPSLTLGAVLLGASTASAQRQFGLHVTSPFSGNPGPAMVGLQDIDGDGVRDYAVGDQDDTTGGALAGKVVVRSGATGLAIWTATGNGGWTACSGSQYGDRLGHALLVVPDLNADGFDELVVSAPGDGRALVQCTDFACGRVHIFSGKDGAKLASSEFSNATFGDRQDGDELGIAIVRIADVNSDGVDEILALADGLYLSMLDGTDLSELNRIPVNTGDHTLAALGDFDGDGLPFEVALGNPGADQVQVMALALGTSVTLTGPSGSAFGAALEFAEGTGTGLDTLLIGAPDFGTAQGRVYQHVSGTGTATSFLTGGSGHRLGASLDHGGNADLNLADGELLVGAPGGSLVRIVDGSGNLVTEVSSSFSKFGESVAWIGQISANGFDEFAVTSHDLASNNRQVHLFHGGPDATLDQDFGPGCDPTGSAIPQLTQNGALVVGGPYSFSLTGAPASSVGFLMNGLPQLGGIQVGACAAHLNPNFPTVTMATFVTNFAGNWTSSTFQVPPDVNLIGLEFAHQVIVQRSTDSVMLYSNATTSRIGW